ncbi:MAG: hypothetical protein RML35_00815 [Chloroherpetonaceae bacterium]|nr:hypothetical protein [Chloroherpetonaceae bacterium]
MDNRYATFPVYAERQRQITEKFLEFYTPSDIKPNQEILVKNRYRAKVQLPGALRLLIAGGLEGGAAAGQALSMFKTQSGGVPGVGTLPSAANIGIGAAAGAGAGALVAALFRGLSILQDEFEITLLDNFSIQGVTGGEVIKHVDGGTGMTHKYHSNKKDFGQVTLEFFRERDHEEYQRTITLFHLFINFGIKCNMLVEKFTLDKQVVTEFILQGVCFNRLEIDPLTKGEGGAWKYRLSGEVFYFEERLKKV